MLLALVLSLSLVSLSDPSSQQAPGSAPRVVRKSAVPVVESTLDVWPQIQVYGGSGLREIPLPAGPPTGSAHGGGGRAPIAPPAPPAPHGGLTPGGGTTLPQPSFPGVGMTIWTPPDPTLAVGPDHVVQTVNMVIAFYSKTGGVQFLQNLDSTGTPGFFESVGGRDFTFDPKCTYDQHSGRFVVVALERYFSGPEEASIDIAVSDDSDPNGVWYKYRTDALITLGGFDYFVDYPGLGVTADAILITGDLFSLNSGPFGGVIYRVFEKAPLLAGLPAVYSDLFDGALAHVQAAHTFGTAPAPLFATALDTTTLRLQAITDPLSSPTFVSADVGVPAFTFPVRFSDTVPNQDGSDIDALDGRLINLAWRDDTLLTAHAIKSGGKILARWYRIAMNGWPASGTPALDQSGTLDLGGAIHTWFPTLTSNECGDVGMIFSRSAPNEHPNLYYTGRHAGDPPGTMTVGPIRMKRSPTGYDGFRWGDFFGIGVDPADGRTFWGVGEYAEDTGTWGTWIQSFSLEAAPVFDAITPCNKILGVLPGEPLSFDVAGTDPNTCDLVTVTASGVPAGASHTPDLPAAGSTTFSWTPTPADIGGHCITYTLSDGTLTTSCPVWIVVGYKIRRASAP